jgi:uncharacterized protein (TIGR04255 family)
MHSPYPHPPIAEAVIELRFGGVTRSETLEAARQRLLKEYPKSEDLRDIRVKVVGGAVGAEVEPVGLVGHKLTSAGGTGVIQIRNDLIAVSQLAPYAGWDELLARVQRALRKTGRLYSSRPLTRVGVRYINRIDIPAADGIKVNHDDYLTVGPPELPFIHGDLGMMSISLSTVIEDGRFAVVLNCGRVAAPLIDQVSILLDIDVSNQVALPLGRAELWDHLNEMRFHKNRIFESCITDQARSLFE